MSRGHTLHLLSLRNSGKAPLLHAPIKVINETFESLERQGFGRIKGHLFIKTSPDQVTAEMLQMYGESPEMYKKAYDSPLMVQARKVLEKSAADSGDTNDVEFDDAQVDDVSFSLVYHSAFDLPIRGSGV